MLAEPAAPVRGFVLAMAGLRARVATSPAFLLLDPLEDKVASLWAEDDAVLSQLHACPLLRLHGISLCP